MKTIGKFLIEVELENPENDTHEERIEAGKKVIKEIADKIMIDSKNTRIKIIFANTSNDTEEYWKGTHPTFFKFHDLLLDNKMK